MLADRWDRPTASGYNPDQYSAKSPMCRWYSRRGPAVGRQFLGLDQHVDEFAQATTAGPAKAVDRVRVDEPREQTGDVIDERRVGDPERRLEGVLGQAGE